MLEWSAGAVKATLGVGGLGLMVLLSELLDEAGVATPFPLVFGLGFAPAAVFMLFGDLHQQPWARRLQASAIAWYAGATLSAGAGALHRGLPRHDLFFLAFVALGAWPCVVAARALRRQARGAAGAPAQGPSVDARFEPATHAVVLQGGRRKWVRVLLVMALFLAIGLMPGYQREQPFMAWTTVAFCGLGVLFALSQIALPAARATLTLDPHGFETRAFGRRSRTAWADVEGFELVRMANAPMIGIAYAPHVTRQRAARALAASRAGIEGAIPDHFEVSGAALALLLERWRTRFASPQSDTLTQS